MKKTQNSMTKLYNQMLSKGLITSGNGWIEKAVEQKNTQLPIAVANSKFLKYDRIDRQISTLGQFN